MAHITQCTIQNRNVHISVSGLVQVLEWFRIDRGVSPVKETYLKNVVQTMDAIFFYFQSVFKLWLL